MMFNAVERTRLSFLVDSLVSAPALRSWLFTQFFTTEPSRELRGTVDALRTAFDGVRGDLDLRALHSIAAKLSAQDSALERAAGLALHQALANIAFPPRSRRAVSRFCRAH